MSFINPYTIGLCKICFILKIKINFMTISRRLWLEPTDIHRKKFQRVKTKQNLDSLGHKDLSFLKAFHKTILVMVETHKFMFIVSPGQKFYFCYFLVFL